ncbi:MAG: hypothetical protein ETSY1_09185 [Candidatus Entotheonella factor]|uniref:Conjugal transfer protein TraD n=1 Tax=Entotheonella factor TaxID=1429438 RepID=W4LSR3_ENTF1|nr:MAG: hypothetical protein ETSY1_09185 [Candidatus Entotheonella factor]
MVEPNPLASLDPEATVDPDVLRAKLADMECPGFEVTFDPHEADALGAFREEALSEEDAGESAIDRDWRDREVDDV